MSRTLTKKQQRTLGVLRDGHVRHDVGTRVSRRGRYVTRTAFETWSLVHADGSEEPVSADHLHRLIVRGLIEAPKLHGNCFDSARHSERLLLTQEGRAERYA